MPQQLQLPVVFDVYQSIDELTSADQALMQLAEQAAATAYAPYSRFLVGTALLLSNGQTVIGSNQENAAYPSGMCAERTALFATGAQHPGHEVVAMAITARRMDEAEFLPVTSCGGCRQVMAEYEFKQSRPIRVLMPGPEGTIYISQSVANLLPLQFTHKSL